MLDAETKIILESFQTSSKVSSDNLAHISSTYRQTLANDLIHLIDKKLVSYEQTLTSTKCLCRIVVSSSLRRDIFSALHVSTTAGYMGEYKTLYRIKLRYLWPQLRRDIKE